MSDENVGGLPELPEPIDAIARNAWGPKPDYYTADQMYAYARAALSAHGQPVVDAELIERLRALQSVFITQDAGWPGSAPHRNVYSARAELIGQAISALGATP